MYSFRDILNNLFIADIFDVFLVALFIYTVFILFKRTHSWPILVGVLVLIGIYTVAQTFNLYLTSIVLQSFFAVFIIFIVIIFQQELRRFFELISFWSTRQIKIKQDTSDFPFDINELLQAVAHMAKEKIGALIILQGKEDVEKIFEGGKRLDGLVSEEILLSIFDPSSLGHDGALVINNSRITRFGVHLPLSKNFRQIGKRGTRHSAALGIAENSDALVIVVSEERGVISVAQNGKLKEMKDMEELEAVVKKFFREIFPNKAASLWSEILRRNSLAKLISIGVAMLIWFVFSFSAETVQRSFFLPITYRNVPTNLFIEETSPSAVTVTFASRGKSAFDRLDEKTIEVAVDAKELQPGVNRIILTEQMIKHPSNFSVVEIIPSEIKLTTKEFKEAVLFVESQIQGKPATGYIIEKIEISPGTIAVYIPEDMTIPEKLFTEKIDITGFKESAEFNAKVILPNKNMRFKDRISPTVVVRVMIQKK